jgi:hypothetical protein
LISFARYSRIFRAGVTKVMHSAVQSSLKTAAPVAARLAGGGGRLIATAGKAMLPQMVISKPCGAQN